MQNLIVFFVMIFSLWLGSSYADESAQYSGNVSYASTSDSISNATVNLGYRNHRRDMTWPYANEAQEAWDFGLDLALRDGLHTHNFFTGTSFEAVLGRKFSDSLLLQGRLGLHSLFRSTKATLTQPIVEAHLIWLAHKSFSLELASRNDFSYAHHQPGPVASGLRSIDSSVTVRARPFERLKANLRAIYEDFSDGNQMSKGEGSIMYGIATTEPWIWVGVGGEYFGYKNNTSALPISEKYYSPRKFRGIGPTVELSIPLSKDVQVAFGGSYNWIKEEDFASGTSYYLNPAIRYGHRDNWLTSLSYTHIRSLQNTSVWSSHSMELSLSTSL